MFFQPPRVKSLSRYAEFGSYLGNRHFLAMLAIAITAHLSIIAIYSMVPRQQIVKIPVRALNIKLSGGSSGNGIHMPISTDMPSVSPPSDRQEDRMNAIHERTPQAAMEKALTPKPVRHPPIKPAKVGTVKAPEEREKSFNVSLRDSMATPKKYIRDNGADDASSLAKAQPSSGGNGSTIGGVAGGQEAISRYTQVISQWIINHQTVAKAVCGEAKAVTGECNARGQAVVRLRISREGRIISNSIERTSGSELVDQAAIMMVRASDPVPSVPSDYPSENQMEFLITVQVDLTAKQ